MSLKGKREDELSKYTHLCSMCRDMTGTREGLEALASKVGFKAGSFGEIERRASQGCLLCAQFLPYRDEKVTQMFLVGNFEEVIFESDHSVSEPASKHPFSSQKLQSIDLKFSAEDDPSSLHDLSRRIWGWQDSVFTSPDDPCANYIVENAIPIKSGIDSIMEQAKSWLSLCSSSENGHQRCAKLNEPLLPSRVIDVNPGLDPSYVRLHISRNMEQAQYVALSYCWGGQQQTTLTTSTVSKKLQAMDTNMLSQTIQDAVLVTRKLNIRYLWVDSLCIIQDSPQDKAIEINSMGNIYNNATLTIAAANAAKCSEGFLSGQHIPPNWIQMPLYATNEELGNLTLETADDHSEEVNPMEPLDSRAWAFQERVLSKRTLIFGHCLVKWRCRSKQPPRPEGLQSLYVDTDGSDASLLPLNQPVVPRLRDESWNSIVLDYSTRHVTFHEDRLLALAGVVSLLNRNWNDTYLAGLWRETLIENLLWQGIGPETWQISTYVAPSWSWASFGGGTNFVSVHSIEAEVVSVTVVPKSIDVPFGQVESGMVTICAPYLLYTDFLQIPTSYFEIYLDHVSDENLDEDIMICVLLGTSYFQRDRINMIGLILEPTRDSYYERVGLFFVQCADRSLWISEKQTVTII